MAGRKVKGPPLPIPPAAMQDSGALLGKKGSGKSSVARLLFEYELDQGHRCGLVDPMGDSTGIKLNPDMTPSRFTYVHIFGGPHADIPITHEDGRKTARILGERDISFIIDLSGMLDTHQRTFMNAFADELYEANKIPMLLMVDEAHEFAPQEKGTVSGVLLNRMRRLTTQGRKRGIFLWVMTQRPARIDKTLLSQTESLIAMKVGITHDADALTDWFELHVPEQSAAARKQLSKLKPGEAFVSFPAGDFFERIQFPMHSTLDTGKTPQHGETVGGVVIPKSDSTDLAKLFGVMSTGDPRDDEIKGLKEELAAGVQRQGNLRRALTERDQQIRVMSDRETELLDLLLDIQNRLGGKVGSTAIEPLPIGARYDRHIPVLGQDQVLRFVPLDGDPKPAIAAAKRRVRARKET